MKWFQERRERQVERSLYMITHIFRSNFIKNYSFYMQKTAMLFDTIF